MSARRLRLLGEASLFLSAQTDLDLLAQAALDAGVKLSGAEFGVFLYSRHSESDTREEACRFSGLPESPLRTLHAARSAFPAPQRFLSLKEELIRVGDVSLNARFRRTPPFRELIADARPARSYLAVPVRERGGELLGAMLYGHPEPDRFGQNVESPVALIAAQVASAIEHANLSFALRAETARCEAAQQLQVVTADRLRQALDAGELGTFTWDRAADLLDLDERAAKLLHATPHTVLSSSALRDQIIPPEDRKTFRDRLRKVIASRGVYAAECRVIAPDGGVSWVAAKGFCRSAGGHVIGMTGTLQDVTLRKAQESALLESDKAAVTGRLAATVAHEINNPLEAVTNLLYLIKTDPELPKSLHPLVEIADSELARVGQIAQQTLEFYKNTSHPTEINLSTLLSKVTDLFARQLGHKQLKCTLDLDPELRLFGYAGEMRQIFSNLLLNAIDASSSGIIHLRARRRTLGSHPGVVVLLSDPGSGIPRHLHKRMFSPFFSTKGPTGTGLGLWVTRGMVEKHGGRIHFRSRTENPTGTVFRVHLPQGFSATATSPAPSTTMIQ